MELIDKRIKKRASNAFKYLPYNKTFYNDVQVHGLDSDLVYQNNKKYCMNSKKWFKNPHSVEKSFRWLIKLGILRREVDGQGLTSKIRLTPLGREILEMYPNLLSQKVSIFLKIHNCFSFHSQL